MSQYSEGLAFTERLDGTYAVVGIGSCEDLELRIPPTTPEGSLVTEIAEDAFHYQEDEFFSDEGFCFLSVIIPDSVTSIGDSAFMGCTSLLSMTQLSRL